MSQGVSGCEAGVKGWKVRTAEEPRFELCWIVFCHDFTCPVRAGLKSSRQGGFCQLQSCQHPSQAARWTSWPDFHGLHARSVFSISLHTISVYLSVMYCSMVELNTISRVQGESNLTSGMLLQSVPTVIHNASKGVEVGADGVLETGEGLPPIEGFLRASGCFVESSTSWHQPWIVILELCCIMLHQFLGAIWMFWIASWCSLVWHWTNMCCFLISASSSEYWWYCSVSLSILWSISFCRGRWDIAPLVSGSL